MSYLFILFSRTSFQQNSSSSTKVSTSLKKKEKKKGIGNSLCFLPIYTLSSLPCHWLDFILCEDHDNSFLSCTNHNQHNFPVSNDSILFNLPYRCSFHFHLLTYFLPLSLFWSNVYFDYSKYLSLFFQKNSHLNYSFGFTKNTDFFSICFLPNTFWLLQNSVACCSSTHPASTSSALPLTPFTMYHLISSRVFLYFFLH